MTIILKISDCREELGVNLERPEYDVKRLSMDTCHKRDWHMDGVSESGTNHYVCLLK